MEYAVITAWSNSRLNTYEQCPFKARLLYIDKMVEPGSAAMDNGKAVHTEIEKYLKGPDRRVPQSAIKLCADYEELYDLKPYTELQVAFNQNWEPVDWFSKQAWCRVVLDAMVKTPEYLWIIDHKTGKMRDGYDDQLSLYGLAGLLMFPGIPEVRTSLFFVDAGRTIDGQTYTAEDLPVLKAQWEDRVKAMLSDTEYRATPNQYCNWCHFRKANGGPCTAA